jgi:hypothetical protein
MRYLIMAIAILTICSGVYSAEVNISLDRCTIFNNPTENSAASKIGLHFAFPDSLMGKEIIYAELRGKISIHNNDLDSLFEFRFYPLLAEWPEGQFDYQNIESITDSLSAGVYTIRLGDSSAFNIDITEYVRGLSVREYSNFGLIGTADLLGDDNIKLPTALGENLRNLIKLRVIYR